MTDVLDEVTEPEAPGEAPERIDGPDDDDAHEGDGADVQPESEADGAASEKEIEQATEKLVAEAKRHASRVSQIMGEDAQVLVPCELCEPAIPGFRWPQVPEDDPRHMIVTFLREGAETMPPEDDEAQRCDRCDGWGVTLTHSRVQMQDTRPCSKCGAKGWTTENERRDYDSQMQSRQVANEIAGHSVAAPAPVVTTPAIDAWGRPQGAPFFGTDPTYMTDAQKSQDWQRTTGF